MKIKKYITVFLSAALGATMLVGCSPKSDNQTQKNQIANHLLRTPQHF